jgi:hypothetical protein
MAVHVKAQGGSLGAAERRDHAGLRRASAKLVADAGYKVTFMSGFAVSAARLGLPDTGLISFTEMLDSLRIAARRGSR